MDELLTPRVGLCKGGTTETQGARGLPGNRW